MLWKVVWKVVPEVVVTSVGVAPGCYLHRNCWESVGKVIWKVVWKVVLTSVGFVSGLGGLIRDICLSTLVSVVLFVV